LDQQRYWDYIVIGAGSAGCAVAHELVSSSRNHNILVLEAGGSDRSPFIRFPAGAMRAAEKYDWGYRSQPDPSCNGATEPWARGRVLGGSSSVNTTVFVRGAARDFDRWADPSRSGSVAGWSASDVVPVFREMETSDQSGPLRGAAGPLHVRTVRKPHALTDAFIASAQRCGHKFNDDYNGAQQEGVSYAQVSQRNGFRCSSADAFLRPLLGRKNIELALNAWVQKIEFCNGRATGVSFLQNGKLRTERAHGIVVSAGAINSPQLLMLSGIGDPEELRRHGIDVRLDLPGVGRNLQEHPSIRLLYKSNVQTYNLTGGFRQKIGFLSTYLASREGPVANVFESVAFLKTSPAEPAPDVQVHFGPVGLLDDRDGCRLAPFPSVSIVVNKSYPLGRGRIRLASNDPKSPPLIECRLLGAEADVDTLVRGIFMIRKIMAVEPVAHLVEQDPVSGPDSTDSMYLKGYVRGHAKTTYHPVGTCRMGTDADSVVGPDLRVRGTENLWVADASIMPDLISGNTNAVCMMIGKKLGSQLAAYRG